MPEMKTLTIDGVTYEIVDAKSREGTVSAATINDSGHLILTRPSGEVMDCGDATGPQGNDGATGADGVGVRGVEVFQDADNMARLVITLTDETVHEFPISLPEGADGVGVYNVEQTTTSTADGGSNVITVTLTDGEERTFTVKNGSKGSDGNDGEPGKSAYAYAQDGGYTGTEADFAEKLAEEAPKAFYVAVTYVDEETQTSDKTFEEIAAAMDAGRPVVCTLRRPNEGTYEILGIALMSLESAGCLVATIPDLYGATWAVMMDHEGTFWAWVQVEPPETLPNPNTLTINGTSYDGSEAVSVDTPKMLLITATDGVANKTSIEILSASLAGYTVYFDVGGTLLPLVSNNGEIAQFMLTLAVGADGFGTVLAMVTSNGTAVEDSIITSALPNPNAMTVNGLSYDGSGEIDFTDTINAMIDTKLNAIGVAEEGSY